MLVSSHLMSEMGNTADRLIIIGRGKLIAQAAIGELLAAGSGTHVKVRSPQAAELAKLLQAPRATVTRESDGMLAVTGVTGVTADGIGQLATASGIPLAELSARQASLEERYMELTKDTPDYHSATPAVAGPAGRK